MTMEQMVKQLNQWAYEYYVLDAPTVADTTYDALYDQLVMLEKTTGITLSDSPTKRVGGQPLKGFVKHKHLNRLYSLDKAQSFQELESWYAKIINVVPNAEFTVELKYDGLTINVTYENGEFVLASTRGNGIEGEDVSEQVKTIKSVPLKIPFKGKIELQGEGIMRLSVLAKYNQLHAENQLKNARNASAGAIRNLDPKVTAERNLDVVFYSNGYSENFNVTNQNDLVEFLKENRFKTNHVFKKLETFEQIRETIEQIAQMRNDLDFLIDGVVVKVNDFDQREIIGYTDKFPKWAIAFKFDAEQVSTKLNNVVWQVGRTGKLTPIGELEPVELCGATISRATLNNFGDIQRKSLQNKSMVFIRRSNDVIPEVLAMAEILPESEIIEKPTKCPACQSELYEYGANLFCPNLQCKPRLVSSIAHYCSKSACDVENLSEKTVETLIDANLINSFVDLYFLKEEQLLKLDGFKQLKSKKIIQSIQNSKNVSLDRLIFALGIGNVGSVTAKDLARTFGSIENLKNATVDELVAIDGIGATNAESIKNYFEDKNNQNTLKILFELGINPIFEDKKYSGVFEGKTIVLTGSLQNYTRQQASKLIEQNGGKLSSTVTSKTNLVICGSDAGSKLQKARDLNVEVIDENAFEMLIKG